ncbi:MAG: acyl-CoA dehydrogenase, partial [Pseudomonadota bacterium]
MAFDETEGLDAFRENTRSWLEENCPLSMRTPIPDGEVVWGGTRERFSNPDS